MNDNRRKREIDILIQTLGELTGLEYDENERVVIEDIYKWAPVIPEQSFLWVKNLYALSVSLSIGKQNASDFRCFWINLHGLFTEVYPYFKNLSNVDDDLPVDIYSKIEKIKAMFSDDEIIFVDYLRQCQVHAFQSALQIKVNKSKTTETGKKINRTYKGRDVLELKHMIRKMIKKKIRESSAPLREAENLIAIDMATRIVEPMDELLNLVDKWRSA